MKAGRVVVVVREILPISPEKMVGQPAQVLTLGVVTEVTAPTHEKGEGLFVQFTQDGESEHFTKASGKVHKIRDEKIAQFAVKTVGFVPPPTMAQANAVMDGFGYGEPEEDVELNADEPEEGDVEDEDESGF